MRLPLVQVAVARAALPEPRLQTVALAADVVLRHRMAGVAEQATFKISASFRMRTRRPRPMRPRLLSAAAMLVARQAATPSR
jgi:hypothetical protein